MTATPVGPEAAFGDGRLSHLIERINVLLTSEPWTDLELHDGRVVSLANVEAGAAWDLMQLYRNRGWVLLPHGDTAGLIRFLPRW